MSVSLTWIDWTFIFALISIWVLLLYHIILVFSGYQLYNRYLQEGEPAPLRDSEYPRVSVLVPAHNEETVIGRTVTALLRMNYPKDKFEVIVVNDSSTDKTGQVLADIQGKQQDLPVFKVVTIVPPQGAKGKSNALMHGLEVATGDYLAIYDADNTPERNALRHLAEKIISDKRLGAVVGRFRTRNRNVNLLTRFVNIETISFQWMIQAGRSWLFKLTTIPGTNFIISRKVLEEVGGWREGALTEDTELTVRIYRYGYRIAWHPHAATWEQEPEQLRVWLRQRVRWCRGNLWVIFHYIFRLWEVRNPRMFVDLIYFMITYVFFFFFIMMSDIFFVLGLFNLVKLNLEGPFTIIWLLAYALFVVETFLTLSMERSEGRAQNFLITALMYFTYCQLWLVVMWMTLFRVVMDKIHKREVKWDKTARSTEG